MKFKKKNRRFKVNKVNIKHVGNLSLNSFETITFISKDKSEYDISKTDWGYYATPSINYRLLKNKFKTFIVFSKLCKKIFIHIVHKNRIGKYKKYLKTQNLEIIPWPNKIKRYINNLTK